MSARAAGVVLVALVAASIALLALPATLAYDPWAWLVWGREVAHLELDTTGGPSWKPLPMVLTTPLVLAGGAAPTAFLVVSRVVGLLALVGAFRLGHRLRSVPAGALAAALLVLTPDRGPRFVRLVLEGHSAPWTAALALWAVERHLAGSTRVALLLTVLLAWDRPEAWPFLLGYAGWLAWRRPADRLLAVAALASVPVLWFGGDWWGSGSPLHGASAAQVDEGEAGRLTAALEVVGRAVLAPVWAIAVAGAALAWSRRDRVPAALVGLALGWSALVVGLAAGLGYAALSRFCLPAAALLCVAGAVGAVDLVGWASTTRGRVVVGVGLAAVLLLAAAPRLTSVDRQLAEVRTRAEADEDLAAVLRAAGGVAALDDCGAISIDSSDVPRPAFAWRADRPIHEVLRPARVEQGTVIVSTGGKADRLLRDTAEAERVAAGERWVAYQVACPDS